MKKEEFSSYFSIFLIRVSIGLIFFWFGLDKLIHPLLWLGWIPKTIINLIPFSGNTFIYILGVVELVLGVLLIVGFLVRIVALFTALNLIGVIVSIGFNDIAVRDFGLLIMAVSLAISKNHIYSIDWLLK